MTEFDAKRDSLVRDVDSLKQRMRAADMFVGDLIAQAGRGEDGCAELANDQKNTANERVNFNELKQFSKQTRNDLAMRLPMLDEYRQELDALAGEIAKGVSTPTDYDRLEHAYSTLLGKYQAWCELFLPVPV